MNNNILRDATLIDSQKDVDNIEDILSYQNIKQKSFILSDYINYCRNKQKDVREIIICAEHMCVKKFKKKTKQQAFCCTKHRKIFWSKLNML